MSEDLYVLLVLFGEKCAYLDLQCYAHFAKFVNILGPLASMDISGFFKVWFCI